MNDEAILHKKVIAKSHKIQEEEKIIAFAGNPNVGKSTLFNSLTGMKQHTGNWAGKTVVNALGHCKHKNIDYILADLPGTYSLFANSEEEMVARDFICFAKKECTVVVCDATCLERNLNLVLQILEVTNDVVVCLNLIDEAQKKGINVNSLSLSKMLGVPVIATSARNNKGVQQLIDSASNLEKNNRLGKTTVIYDENIEEGIRNVQNCIDKIDCGLNPRWIALRLIENDQRLVNSIYSKMDIDELTEQEIKRVVKQQREILQQSGIDEEMLKDKIVSSIVKCAEKIANKCVKAKNKKAMERDRKIDKIIMSRAYGIPLMLAMLFVVFWITLTGANYISEAISNILEIVGKYIDNVFIYFNAPQLVRGLFMDGMFKVLSWVVAVMLPPMAIFFPLFTLLEDFGYLPRVAFNLDRYFKRAKTCGKQCLTMCAGFGCNAVGIEGCRIIDSPRERLVAMLTNNFVPCNGRFPMLISIITMFFIGYGGMAATESILSALMLTSIIVFSVIMTFIVSWILSKTLLRGKPSSFTLELPPYRMPQFGKVIVRSIFDRTLFVLFRAVVVAIPAGIIIWLVANIYIGDMSILNICVNFLNPFANLIGLDGAILMAFILGFPANEIVMPIIIMTYMSTGTLMEMGDISQLHTLLVSNGWTWVTAICTMLFSLIHWPCSTACLTIKKESGSIKWTLVAILIPTVLGFFMCFCVANLARLFNLV